MTVRVSVIDAISPQFPDPSKALSEPNGLLAVGGNLESQTLLDAYQRGIFPWFAEDEPLLWWSPDPRMVLVPAKLHVSRSLKREMRKNNHRITFDTAFEQVITACALPRKGQPGTWITDSIRLAYTRLHRLGYAHSVEVWMGGGLAGGLYGVELDRVFFGESMFSFRSNASKLALVALCQSLSQRGFALIDCQQQTQHLQSLGARPIPRADFLDVIADNCTNIRPGGPWHSDQ